MMYYLGAIYIDERPPVLQCLLMGVQHVLAMFGSTVLGKKKKTDICTCLSFHSSPLIAPLMMGFDTNSNEFIMIRL